MIVERILNFLNHRLKFLFRVFILARTWGVIKIILFIPYELYYMFKIKTHTLFSVNNIELDVESEEKLNATEYFPTPYYIVSKVFKLVKNELVGSIFIDIGCGAGRVLTFVYKFKPKKIIGVEFSKNLFLIAEKNLSVFFKNKKNVDWELIHKNIINYSIPKNANVFFFYDPFDAKIMDKVIKKIKLSVKKQKRQILIIYISPRNRDLFSNNGFRLIHSEINSFNKGFVVFKYN